MKTQHGQFFLRKDSYDYKFRFILLKDIFFITILLFYLFFDFQRGYGTTERSEFILTEINEYYNSNGFLTEFDKIVSYSFITGGMQHFAVWSVGRSRWSRTREKRSGRRGLTRSTTVHHHPAPPRRLLVIEGLERSLHNCKVKEYNNSSIYLRRKLRKKERKKKAEQAN